MDFKHARPLDVSFDSRKGIPFFIVNSIDSIANHLHDVRDC